MVDSRPHELSRGMKIRALSAMHTTLMQLSDRCEACGPLETCPILDAFDDIDTAFYEVAMWTRRLAAIAAALTLCVGNVSVCGGWQPTPEARMACCKNGRSCPMHKSESHGSGSRLTITQAQADSCCAAASNRTQSSLASATFALTQITTLPAAARMVVHVPVLALQHWRALVPLPASPVPIHLLLSVLLV